MPAFFDDYVKTGILMNQEKQGQLAIQQQQMQLQQQQEQNKAITALSNQFQQDTSADGVTDQRLAETQKMVKYYDNLSTIVSRTNPAAGAQIAQHASTIEKNYAELVDKRAQSAQRKADLIGRAAASIQSVNDIEPTIQTLLDDPDTADAGIKLASLKKRLDNGDLSWPQAQQQLRQVADMSMSQKDKLTLEAKIRDEQRKEQADQERERHNRALERAVLIKEAGRERRDDEKLNTKADQQRSKDEQKAKTQLGNLQKLWANDAAKLHNNYLKNWNKATTPADKEQLSEQYQDDLDALESRMRANAVGYGLDPDKLTQINTPSKMQGTKPQPVPSSVAGSAQGMEELAKASWGSYDPNTYEYRVGPSGQLQRRKKE